MIPKLFKGMNNILQNGIFDLHTQATFQALVHAIIPNTLWITTSGVIEGIERLDLKVYEYIIWTLDYSLAIPIKRQLNLINTSMSKSTAQLLDAAASQLIWSGQVKSPLNGWAFLGGGSFAALLRDDRLRVIAFLDQLKINLGSLPIPYQNNPGLIRNMMDVLSQLTMFGYYSEWNAYGTTRLLPPDYRQIEYFPVGWIQSGYPGPAFGYRDLRGFLVDFPHKEGNS
ncbi:hypothetical protein [Peribacillus asahii]|uniref:hypothetical protein n=1 Tax=Peribacillus asahii TaxID=228899 RepID=UPI0020797573|nr:hypothetical protein [Peribacillus asahii]USK72296.1 hypothetical protein LIS76_11350 [Peribacillus asahii]